MEKYQNTIDNLSSLKPQSYSSFPSNNNINNNDDDDDDDDSDDDSDEDDDSNDDEDDEDDSDDEEDEILHSNDFALRKLCINIFEELTERYDDQIMQIIAPILPRILAGENHWSVVESAIVTIGILADISPSDFSSSAVSFLLSSLSSQFVSLFLIYFLYI